MNPDDYIHAQSRYCSFRPVIGGDLTKRDEMDKFLESCALKITEALHLIPECKNLEVGYRNILERDMNPDGYTGYFRIIDHRAFSPGSIATITWSQIPKQPGDTENNVSVPE